MPETAGLYWALLRHQQEWCIVTYEAKWQVNLKAFIQTDFGWAVGIVSIEQISEWGNHIQWPERS